MDMTGCHCELLPDLTADRRMDDRRRGEGGHRDRDGDRDKQQETRDERQDTDSDKEMRVSIQARETQRQRQRAISNGKAAKQESNQASHHDRLDLSSRVGHECGGQASCSLGPCRTNTKPFSYQEAVLGRILVRMLLSISLCGRRCLLPVTAPIGRDSTQGCA